MPDDTSFPVNHGKRVKNGKPSLQSPPLARILDSRVLEGPSKKMSPLKHVSPILKKYSTQRHGKNVKGIRPKTKSKQQVSSSFLSSSVLTFSRFQSHFLQDRRYICQSS